MATVTRKSHLQENPYEVACAQLRRVADTFGVEKSLVRVLERCKKGVIVSIPTRMDAAEIANLRDRHARGVLSDTEYAVEVAQLVQGATGRCYDPTWLNELLAGQTQDAKCLMSASDVVTSERRRGRL